MTWHDEWRNKRAALAAQHDAGALDAVREAASADCLEVQCGSYCYGGSAHLDASELLAELAEAGWRLVRCV